MQCRGVALAHDLDTGREMRVAAIGLVIAIGACAYDERLSTSDGGDIASCAGPMPAFAERTAAGIEARCGGIVV